jgi:hypothetical protein
VIAYLQRMGKDISQPPAPVEAPAKANAAANSTIQTAGQ